MRKQDRYFIFNHDRAFSECYLSGVEFQNGGVSLADGQDSGILLTPALDSGISGNLWQRVVVDMLRPEDTRVRFKFFCFDREHEAEITNKLYKIRGNALNETPKELEPYEVFSIDDAGDFQLLGAKGQYLAAAAEFYRQGDESPVIYQLRIYAAQESFLDYLPEIFRWEGEFLDRFLRLFSVQYLELEEKIAAMPAALDPLVTAPDNLRRLAEMMGIPNIELWETRALRKLLLSRVYARKGTLSGLRELIEIYTGRTPHIVESFRMQSGVDEIDALYGGFRLLVLMPGGIPGDVSYMAGLYTLIQGFIPETVNFKLVALENKACVSGYTYLDVNACLSGYGSVALEAGSRIGYVVLEE